MDRFSHEALRPFGADTLRISVATGLYLAVSRWPAEALTLIGISPQIRFSEFQRHPISYSFIHIALLIPALLLLADTIKSSRSLRAALRDKVALLLGITATAFALRIAFDASHAVPFWWRFTTPATLVQDQILMHQKAWMAMAIVVVTTGLAVPFIEEVVFRFGLLRAVNGVTNSKPAAIIVSAVVFGATHFGPPFRLAAGDFLRLVWILVTGLLLGWLTVRDNGRITKPLAIHVGINLSSDIAYFLTITSMPALY